MNKIVYQEKTDNISWEEIKSVLVAAHAQNVSKGIVMRYPSLPAAEIEKKIKDGNGKMFVALDGDKLVGVSAYIIKRSNVWYCNTDYMYLCFSAVLPEYNGRGIYKALYICLEREKKRHGISIEVFDTHEKNKRIQKINERNGFRKVDYKQYGDHCNVVMAKWAGKCPYSPLRILLRYWVQYIKVRLRNFN